MIDCIIADAITAIIFTFNSSPVLFTFILFISVVFYYYLSTYLHEIAHAKSIIKYSKELKSFNEPLWVESKFTHWFPVGGNTNSNFLDYLELNINESNCQTYIKAIAISGIISEFRLFIILFMSLCIIYKVSYLHILSGLFVALLIIILFLFGIHLLEFFKESSDFKIFKEPSQYTNTLNNSTAYVFYKYTKSL